MTDPRLGRHVNHDERSRLYPFRATSRAPLQNVRHTRHVPVWDQGNVGSCTGQAALGCAGTGALYGPASGRQKSWTVSDAVAVYSQATVIDRYLKSYPPDDTGSDGLSVAKVLTANGLISGYLHTFSFDDLLIALQQGPLIVGTNWYESMFEPDPQTAEVQIAHGSPVAGGHEYILDEYNAQADFIGATNSWGTGWGRGGRFCLHASTLRRLLAEDGDGTVFLPAGQLPPEPIDDEDLARFATKIAKWRRSSFPVFGAHPAQSAVDAYLRSKGL